MPLKRLMLSALIVFPLALLAAKDLTIPDSIDPTKSVASFSYKVNRESLSGKRESWQVKLEPNGLLRWSGIYVGEAHLGCSNIGGTITRSMSSEDHGKLVIEALKIAQANPGQADQKSRRSRSRRNQPPKLFVEYNDFTELVSLPQKASEETEAFITNLRDISLGLLKDKDSSKRLLSLQVKRDEKKPIIIARFTNEGSEPLKFALPDEAGEHFILQPGMGQPIPLVYRSAPAQREFLLTPGKHVDVSLKIPKGVPSDTGLLVYENQSTNDDKKNSLNLRLCPVSPEGQRTEFK